MYTILFWYLFLIYWNFFHFYQEPKYHKLDAIVPSKASLSKFDALKYYKQMQQIRRMEAEASKLYKEKVIRGFCHLYTGQVKHLSFQEM